jgi:glycine cleavage system H protein|tara:strand:+ start:653 stop:1045 length:393 start_codon:yes stop_codon:yes gene_type:complete
MDNNDIPVDLRYTETHEWVQVESDIATVGITHFAQSELGDIVFIELPEISEYLRKGEMFGSIEAVKTLGDLISPLSGEVLETNEVLEDDAEAVNKDPYGAGWLIKIRIEDESEVDNLFSNDDYGQFLEGV